MKRLLCEVDSANVDELFSHCIQFHHINKTNYFKKLFESYQKSCFKKKCYRRKQIFHRCRKLKNHYFLSHYQFGGQLPVESKAANILRRSNFLMTFSINFDQHQDFYNFYDSEKLVDDFLSVVELKFLPTKNVEVQVASFLINYHPAESEYLVEIIDKRSWITDVYDCFF